MLLACRWFGTYPVDCVFDRQDRLTACPTSSLKAPPTANIKPVCTHSMSMLVSEETIVLEAPVSPAQSLTRTSVVPASIARIMAVHKLVALVAPLPLAVASTVVPLPITVTTTPSLC